MPNTNRDLINSAMGGSQDLNQDDYQSAAGGASYAGLPNFYVTYQGIPVASIGQPVTNGAP